ncbi:MAG: histidine phosphatase family protein [Candidatus Puniceispirillum sp.]
MARIILLRHGKAEMPSIDCSDFDRPLNARGTQNAAAIGKFLASHKLLPELVLVSPARRTLQTWDQVNQEWQDCIPVRLVDSLYEASAQTVLSAIFDNAGDCRSVMVIGHNPSLVVLLNHLTSNHASAFNTTIFPTCTLADIGFEAAHIADIDCEHGRLISLKTVRDL